MTRTTATLLTLLVLALAASPATSGAPKQAPAPKRIVLDARGADYLRVLGEAEAYALHSGYVVLAPGKSVGEHDTEAYEELVVVLAGAGELRVAGGPTFALAPGVAAYCPPHVRHDVRCTGGDTLRYVYVVTKASR